MDSRPRVIIVDNSIDITGALKSIVIFTDALKYKYEFIYILPKRSNASKFLYQKGYEVEELNFIEISKSVKNVFLYFPQLLINAYNLLALCSKHNAVLVHVNDFYNLIGVLAKVIGGDFYLINHVRFMPNRFPKSLVDVWLKLNLRYSSAVICVSKAVKVHLPEHYKIKVIYDAIGEDLPIVEKPKKKTDIVTLLYLSHYIEGKGQDLAIKAFFEAYKLNPNLRLKFVGGDMGLLKNKMYKDYLIREAHYLGLEEVIIFDGPTKNIATELSVADIFLNFSESESFSRTCLEALTFGVPLIVSDSGGPAELFEHGKSGWLVPNRDLEAMKTAILTLSNDNVLRERFGINGKVYVKSKFSVQTTIMKLESLYMKTLSCS